MANVPRILWAKRVSNAWDSWGETEELLMILCGFVTTSETYYYIILHITLKYLTCCFIKILIHLQTVSYIFNIILFDFTKATIFDSCSVFMVTAQGLGSMTSTSFSPLLYIDTHFHPAQHTAASCLPSFVVASVGISSLSTALYLHLNTWCHQHDSAVPCTTLETFHQNSARYIWYQSLSS